MVVDYRLSFRPHACKVAAKAAKAAGLVARLSKCRHGLPPKAAVVATRAVVEAQVHYALEAWWPGPVRTRLGRTHGTGATAVAAVRAAVPAWRTTPTASVRATAGRPPTLVVAVGRKKAYVRRLLRQGPGHPARDRLLSGKDTRLTRTPDGPIAQQWYRQNSSLACGQQLQPFRYNPVELALPRGTLHKLVADRTGHGFFRSYFERFKPDAPELAAQATCACGSPLEPSHALRCPGLKGHGRRPPLWGRTKKWLNDVEDFYNHQDYILENYSP